MSSSMVRNCERAAKFRNSIGRLESSRAILYHWKNGLLGRGFCRKKIMMVGIAISPRESPRSPIDAYQPSGASVNCEISSDDSTCG